MKHLSFKRYGTDDQPLILDFDINQTNEPESHFSCGEIEDRKNYSGLTELGKYFMEKSEGHQEKAWIAIDVWKNNHVELQIGFDYSKWRFRRSTELIGWPSVWVTPCLTSRSHRYKFQAEEIAKNFNNDATLKATPWIDLAKKLYSRRVLLRFPAVVSVAGPPQRGPSLNMNAKLPTYSEVFLFIKKLDLI